MDVVVGIGASAGGLEALEALFAAMPVGLGIAFVVVQHLDPRHKSLLPELLGRRTRLPVTQATDGVRPEPDRVYVIAPGTVLTVADGVLRVAPSDDPSTGRVDAFLQSLARDRGERAVAVVLSGAGTDGLVGARTVKGHGGLVLAQDPQTAAYGSMPRAAIEAGLVDEVLPVERIPAALVAHVREVAQAAGPAAGAALDAELAASLQAICAVLGQRTGHDFGGYKEATLLRRIRRRVLVQRAASATDYLRILEDDPAEPERLLKDLLIGVTHFFRDPEVFAALARDVLPRLFEGKTADDPTRIWVPGCASGEEAYTIAMLVHEHLARTQARRFVQIFATDLDSEMIAEARAGRYPEEIAEHVSRERLERFFARDGSGWRVGGELRDLCIFSVHSLIRDPPFSALDLVSCRNVLIYLEPELQRKVIPLFHYALRSGGHLVLGPAEAVSSHADLFATADKKHRILRRKDSAAHPHVEFPLSPRPAPRPDAPAPGAPPPPRQKATAAIERMLLDDYTPPCAVVDERGDLEFVAGRLGRYLAPPAGAPATNLLDAVRDSLRRELRTALHASASSNARVVRDRVPVELEDGAHSVRLTVRPVPGAPALFAVILQERATDASESGGAPAEPTAPPALELVEAELRSTRADLNAAVESSEAANEELRSANEELISTNEELQSANEELQTSKEEFQSLNEELETVNAELLRKVDELAVANADLQNLFASTEIATVFVDRELRIARFTPASTALLRVREADVGRPLSDLGARFDGCDLAADVAEALRTLKPLERQVRSGDDRWLIERVLPYRTAEDAVAGAVVTFVDVSELKRAEAEVRSARERAEWLASFPALNPIPIAEVDTEGRVHYANAAADRLFPNVRAEGTAHPWLAGWDAVARTFRDDRALTHERVVEVGDAAFQQNMYVVPGTERIRIYSVDVTRRKQTEAALERSRAGFRRLADASLSVIRETDLQHMLQVLAEAALALTGARLATCGHGYVGGRFTVGGSARAAGAPRCPPGDMFLVQRGGVHLELSEHAETIRLTDAQLRAHPAWWGLPEGHVPMRGMLGARMVGRNGQTSGVILVTDKEQGDFTEQDESLLRQLATIASLALQHVEGRIALEESDRSKNHFLAILSHELRNPLAPIRNSVYILDRATPGGDQARRAQGVIERQVTQLTRLVDDLLDVTRIARGKIQLRCERLDLREVVRRAVEDQRVGFTRQAVEVELAVLARPVWVLADRTRVAQIVGNLLENAAKFTEPGGRATVSVEENAAMADAIVRVRDTGAGIAPQILPRIFEPFMQGDTTLDRSKGGLGLGLALVKGLTEMHGGTVSVESEGVGRGTTFTVRLPLVDAASAPDELQPGPGRVPPRRVLVVEDNADSAQTLREVLEMAGHTVEVALSGTEGIEKGRSFRPEVVLCDIGLPGMNGYDVARVFRADAELRGARLVALSGYAAPDDLARSRSAGFDAHVAKPATVEALARVLA